ncbi:MAG: ArsR family transcriptional regulator [Gemmatimonadales bacterium]|nr:MAG: ArsR family transcriptional regulator [Gemmatimonadales bacterium]
MPEPQLSWDYGTAYDLFASLYVIHLPADFGLRASWAAGIRTRLSPDSRDPLAVAALYMNIPCPWLLALPQPKAARSVLDALEAMPPGEILPRLASDPESREPCEVLLRKVREQGRWNDADVEQYRSCMGPAHAKTPAYDREFVARWLDCWAKPEQFGETYRRGLREFYEVFYREEERRILPALDLSLARARELAGRVSVAELFEQLSRGIRVEYHLKQRELWLVPCWWCTPRILYTNVAPGREVVLFGARPPEASLVPGDLVPGDLLLSLEALSDPTRLAILQALIEAPLTQADIARRLRLRPPTISHHLKSLRIAGLIAYIGEETGETRYGVRRAQIGQTCEQLKTFLKT